MRRPRAHATHEYGDGEAETGPLATAWHSNTFLDAATNGAIGRQRTDGHRARRHALRR
ncbi:hypothetical protein [Roseateles sp.]|uniref:hypothetical protein n=1 Tax=Roseateles sp. TaxID=1971397 RepID=UPI00387ECBA8